MARLGLMALLCGFVVIAMPAPGRAQGQSLRFGLAEDPDVLDPTQARTFVGRIVFSALCDKLFDISPDLKIVPQLATGWEWTDENKGLIIKLRPGVVFHDGEPFDAAAAKYSIERHQTLPGSLRKSELSSVKSVEIVDDHTVKLVLSAPFSPLLAQLADRAGMMVSPKAAGALGANFGTHPVCAGPYKFVERIAQDRIVVERFPQYWDPDKIKLQRITYLPIPDSTVRLANLQSGGLDIVERVAATDLDTIRADKKLKTADVTEIGYQGITFNTMNGERSKNPLGQDARVRQAFSLAIDREALIQVVYNGEYQAGNQWLPPQSPYYQKDFPVPARDVAKARSLLAEAKAPNPLVTLMVPNNPDMMQVGQVIQAMTKEAGFDVQLQSTEFASALQLSMKGDFQAFLIAWSGRVDPDGNIYNFLSCKGPLNDGRYCNPDVDKALDAARQGEAPQRGSRPTGSSPRTCYVTCRLPISSIANGCGDIRRSSPASRPIPTASCGRKGCRCHDRCARAMPRRTPSTASRRYGGGAAGHERVTAFLLRRLALLVPTLFFVSLLIFGLQQLLPGDPALALAGEDRDPQVIAHLREQYHLDRSFPERYALWLGGVLSGDFGESIRIKRPVLDLVLEKLPVTAELATLALLIALTIGVPLGIISAVRNGSAIDYAATVMALWGLSIPNFWFGILLIMLFSVELGWLPASGYVSPGESLSRNLSTLIMPAFVLGNAIAAIMMRHTRSAMLQVLEADYVRTAHAKGLSERSVILRHALRNALVPVVTLGALEFGQLLSGAVLTEQVFTIPGFGKLIVDAVFNRDYAVVQGVVLVTAALYILLNLLADCAYVLLDPRLRH